MIRTLSAGILGVLAVVVFVRAAAGVTPALPRATGQVSVAGFDLASPVNKWELPGRLSEISGLAVVAADRVLAHNDEDGRLFELDYHRGTITREFQMGSPVVKADFEGIEVVDDVVTLMTSDGRLFSASLPLTGSIMAPVVVRDTRLGKQCELEGLTLARDGAWLLPCKVPRRRTRDVLFAVYGWTPSTTGTPRPRLVVPRGKQKRALQASAIATTAAGTFLVLFGPDRALGEFAADGTPLALAELSKRAHPQPEGLTITRDGLLLIADEGQGRSKGQLTVYGSSQ